VFRSRRAGVLVALVLGTVIGFPACVGSSSKPTANGTETETSADEPPPAAGGGGQLSAGRCQELAGRWQNIVAGPATAVGGGTEDAATLRSQINALTNEIPEQISAAFAVFATSTEKILELMNGYDQHEVADGDAAAPSDLDARLESVAEISASPELTDALAQIEAYFAASCPPA